MTREAHVGYRARRGISKASAPAFSAKNARLNGTHYGKSVSQSTGKQAVMEEDSKIRDVPTK